MNTEWCVKLWDFANNELVPIAGVTDKEHKFLPRQLKEGDLGLLSCNRFWIWRYRTGLCCICTRNGRNQSRLCVGGSNNDGTKYLVLFAREKHGTHEQESICDHLPLVKRLAALVYEPGNGSDVGAASTTDETMVTLGYWTEKNVGLQMRMKQIARLFATTDKSLKHKGISAFIVEKGTPGFSLVKEDKLGIRGSSTANLIFDNCQFKENLLGEPGHG